MTIGELFAKAKVDRLRIGILAQGTHGGWYCYVYRKTKLHGVGFGATPEEVLELALNGHSYIEKPPQPVASQFADLLG